MQEKWIKNLLLPEYLDAICRATKATHLRYVPHIYTVLGAKQQTIQDPLQFQEISRHHSDLFNLNLFFYQRIMDVSKKISYYNQNIKYDWLLPEKSALFPGNLWCKFQGITNWMALNPAARIFVSLSSQSPSWTRK